MHNPQVIRIVHTLKGKMHAPNSGTCFCPCHDNRKTPALSVSVGDNGTLLVKCFAGCDPIDILQELRAQGLTDPYHSNSCDFKAPISPLVDFETLPPLPIVNDKSKTAFIRKIQSECVSARDTIIMQYLRSRGIDIIPSGYIQYHPNLYHSPTKQHYPAMIGLVTQIMSHDIIALHRTFLTPSGQKANIPQNRMMFGKCNGGGVMLARGNSGILCIAEGIETTLSIAEMHPDASVIAALSSAGIKNFILPDHKGKLIIGADGDDTGIEAAQSLAERATHDGWEVFIKKAPQGKDWNDILRERKNYV